MNFNASARARFERKVASSEADACWEWQGGRNRSGYGKFWIDGHTIGAHRAAFEIHVGEVPPGLYVCHRCDNPPCCNPAHLFLGSASDNAGDRNGKGRQARGARLSAAMRSSDAYLATRVGEGNPKAKLTVADVREIRSRYAAGGITQAQLAGEYGIGQVQVSHICIRRSWKHVA